MTDPISLDAILACHEAASLDQFPAALAALHRLLPVRGDPAGPEDLLALVRMLHAIARRDLPLARLFEGHVDAL